VPQVIIIAGPNGAGKTTFASEYLADLEASFDFVNADEIARSIAQVDVTASLQQIDTRAARLMLERMDTLAKAGNNFALETTLASRSYARKIPLWRRSGYTVSLIYLRLANVEEAVARVHRRVAAGGHDIPEKIIRRRFEKSIAYLEGTYKPIVDEWYIYDSLEGNFRRSENSESKDG
jgi:predicted ABC-type ATPase